MMKSKTESAISLMFFIGLYLVTFGVILFGVSVMVLFYVWGFV